jgi:hypothetical protein
MVFVGDRNKKGYQFVGINIEQKMVIYTEWNKNLLI